LSYIAGILALIAANTVFVLCAEHRPRTDPQLEAVLNGPSAVDRFRQGINGNQSLAKRTPPLVVQAEAFSRHLNPPRIVEKPSAPARMVSSVPPAPPIRPPAPSVRFKLRGTSYYPNRPGRSMALISETGSAEGSERWVKEGTQLGHFVIEEIRRGAIVYRDGNNLREMAVEHGASPPGIVRDIRPGSRRVRKNR
jgi:hypothetical protein